MTNPLPSLKERIETAEGFDRELDRDIGVALAGWHRENGWLVIDGSYYPDHPGSEYPSFTESLDATLALVEMVLPGSTYFIGKGRNPKDGLMYIVGFCRNPEKTFVEVEHDNLCLCILLALLTVLTQDHGDENVG